MAKEERRLLIADRLTSLIKEKYGTFGTNANTKEFIADVNEKSPDVVMTKNLLSPILHGKKKLNDKNAVAFAKVLGVDAAYLKGFQDYPIFADGMANQVATKLREKLCEGYEAEYKKDDVIKFFDTPSEELTYEEAKAAVRYFRYRTFKLMKKYGEI